MSYSARRDGFLISTDRWLIDIDAVHAALSRMYWSVGIPREVVERGINHSIAFGVYDTTHARASEPAKPEQIGLARVISDCATFAYLSDVYILESHRGRGLSKWLVEVILAHRDLQGLRRFCLLTRDAHSLYARYGFQPIADPSRYMEIIVPDIYTRGTVGG